MVNGSILARIVFGNEWLGGRGPRSHRNATFVFPLIFHQESNCRPPPLRTYAERKCKHATAAAAAAVTRDDDDDDGVIGEVRIAEEREGEGKRGEFFRASTQPLLFLPLPRNLLLAEICDEKGKRERVRERDVRIEIAEISRKEFREGRNRSHPLSLV